MKDFIILFDGGEGSSAIVSQLKNFDMIDIIWFEPFDNHHLNAPISPKDLNLMFDIIYGKKEEKDKLDALYKKYSNNNISSYDTNKSVGFKMRPKTINIVDVLKKNDVIVFVLIRENKLKWGLSKLEKNTLQFELVQGKISENPKINVDFDKLSENIKKCETIIERKYKMVSFYENNGITVKPIYYEKFCNDKVIFFKEMFKLLDIDITDEKLMDTLQLKKSFFRKVHSDDASKFVNNYEELLDYVKKNNLEKFL